MRQWLFGQIKTINYCFYGFGFKINKLSAVLAFWSLSTAENFNKCISKQLNCAPAACILVLVPSFNSMSLSEDESEYIEVVQDRAMRQIDCNVWEGIQRDRLTGWFGSLRNIEAELLGAYLLDNLCYRSRGQYSAMLDALFLDLFMPGGMNGALLVDAMRGKRAANPSRGACLAPVLDIWLHQLSQVLIFCGSCSGAFSCTVIG
jgi:hypothetical protein